MPRSPASTASSTVQCLVSMTEADELRWILVGAIPALRLWTCECWVSWKFPLNSTDKAKLS